MVQAVPSGSMDSLSDKFSLCPACRQIHSGAVQFCPRDGTRLDGSARILAGKFILGAQIGVGSMGAIYEAEQPAMERKVAVKLLHPERTRDPMMVQRFEREARAAGKITHQNVITIYESGRAADGQVYLAMERLRGESLADLLRREGRLSPARALPLWLQAVRGTAAAHQQGVIHRDLKPENLFLGQTQDEGAEEQVKILDFGIAKLQTTGPLQAGTLDGTILGTLQYMAPEQIEGRKVDPRADVYALGLILYEMLSGRLPWGDGGGEQSLSMIYLRLMKPPLPLAEVCPCAVPPEWQRLLDDVLAIDLVQRPAHGGELLSRARQVLAAAPPPWPAACEATAVGQDLQATVPYLPPVPPPDGDRTSVTVLPGAEKTAQIVKPSLESELTPADVVDYRGDLQEHLAPDEDIGDVTRIQDILPGALLAAAPGDRVTVSSGQLVLRRRPLALLAGLAAALAGAAAALLLVWQGPRGAAPQQEVRVLSADMASPPDGGAPRAADLRAKAVPRPRRSRP